MNAVPPPIPRDEVHAERVAHERAVELAEQDLPIIASLLESKGWAYLQRRLTQERQALRDKIADDETLTARETRILRRVIKTYGEIMQLPHRDRLVHTATLKPQR